MREPAAAFIGGAVGALARAGVLEALPHGAGRTALAPAYAAVSLAAGVAAAELRRGRGGCRPPEPRPDRVLPRLVTRTRFREAGVSSTSRATGARHVEEFRRGWLPTSSPSRRSEGG